MCPQDVPVSSIVHDEPLVFADFPLFLFGEILRGLPILQLTSVDEVRQGVERERKSPRSGDEERPVDSAFTPCVQNPEEDVDDQERSGMPQQA